MSLLETIQSPDDLKKLTLPQLEDLSRQLREVMVHTVSATGGHLASSLGAVELTVALYKVYDPPRDRILWDVGHQAYAHKLLTGRQSMFSRLRQFKGLSGFPKRGESPYDILTSGHSSTSISAGLGLARARDLAGKKHQVVSVIGDGSISNGLALEGLNDAGHSKTGFLVVLNDNRMSISAPVGGLSNYLNRIITGNLYNYWKNRVEGMIQAIPKVGPTALKLANFLEEAAKGLVAPGMLFEELGFRYFGPVDGHNLAELIETFERVRQLSGPILLHVRTQKGKGYAPAEKNPEGFHGTPKFNATTGERQASSGLSFSEAFAQSLRHEARKNKAVTAVVAAMTSGTALDEFAREYPERFFDVGIAEGHAVTMAAGLAASGLRPVVAVYSTFLQRAYDQIFHDVCLQNLPVVFAIDRAGLVGEDGPTHHGVFDLAYLRHLPNLTVWSPSNARELAAMLRSALRARGPVAIRYPRGLTPAPETRPLGGAFVPGKARLVKSGKDLTLLALGPMLELAIAAAGLLEKERVQARVIDARSVKPLDGAMIQKAVRETGALITLEDHVLAGGFGSAVLEFLQTVGLVSSTALDRVGFPDAFIGQGRIDQLREQHGLTPGAIARRSLALMKKKMKR